MEREGGSRLAEYSFLRPVGKGSYGEVNLAKLRSDGKKYVIKKLNLRNASSRERKAAEQEAQLLSRLKHPNIVAYRESWEGEEGLLYIVMDFCEGGDLYHKLKEQKGILLEEKQVVEWFVQITMALQYLHNEHIMHRDLKTQNIFLTRTDIIKVGDLGIARVLDNQYDMASTLIGTPYYMSPELFSNQPYNYKSDVWALGCCVYEMATLKHAFNAKDMNSLVFRIIEGKLPTMPKNYSPELGELIGTMLSKDPKHRPNARDILKRPYIKHHISVFLENIKKRPARNPKRTPQSKGDASSAKAAPQEKDLISRQSPAYSKSNKDQPRKKSPVRRKPGVDAVPEESIPEHCESSNNTSMSSASVSITTLSKVDIDMSSIEKAGPRGDHLIPSERRRSSLPQETRLHKKKPIGVRLKKDQFKANPKLDSKPENHDMAENEDTMKLLQPLSDHEKLCVHEQLDSTEKLLEPFVPISIPDGSEHKNAGEIEVKVSSALQPNCSDLEPSISRQKRHKLKEQQGQNSEKFDAALPRPLPSPPSAKRNINKKTRRNAEAHSSDVPEFSRDVVELQDRPLSARERRRLRKSQEEMLPSAPRFVGVSSHSSCGELKAEIENEDITKSQSSPDLAIPQNKDVAASHFSDDDLGSTSSTDKSEADPKEGKSDSSEMFDLVELMTQTLKIEPKDRCETPQAPVSEFRPRRKYRDTLILHGKAAEEPQEFPFNEFPSDTGSEKVRRMIEALRMDVVHGLGVKLLEKVYDIMNEDDEAQREMHLQEHMGEKYASYSSKVRQLKFFEENAQF